MSWNRCSPEEKLSRHTTPEPNTGCLLWTGATYQNGYGATTLYDRPTKAHRLAWILANGPIPDGMMVIHSCDVRCCVEVSHLRLGTHKENMADRRNRGRSVLCGAKGDSNGSRTRPERMPRGERHGMAKLTDDQRSEIVRLARSGMPRREVGARFGICHQHVWKLMKAAP